jgi:WD40 repeat protein
MTNLPALTAHWPAFSPDGRWLAYWQKDWITVWATADWSLRRRIPHSSEQLAHAMAFSPDGRILAIADYDRDVRLIQFETGAELATLPARRMTTTLGFSPAGDRLAVAHESGYLQLWDLRRVREQLTSIHLDWDMPPYPPAKPARTSRAPRVIVHTNAPANLAAAGAR